MNTAFAFAVALRRVYDSGAPEIPARFFAGDCLLHPLEKGNGLYVFLKPAEKITVHCRGYLPASVAVKPGEVAFVALYPGPRYNAPQGWSCIAGEAFPGEVLCWPDPRYQIRMAGWDAAKGAAQLLARPGFCGGTLLFGDGVEAAAALILEKEPPDTYYLAVPGGQLPGGMVRRAWTAMADEEGNYIGVAPERFSCGEPLRGRGDGRLGLAR